MVIKTHGYNSLFYQELTNKTLRDLKKMYKLGVLHKVGDGKTTKHSVWITE